LTTEIKKDGAELIARQTALKLEQDAGAADAALTMEYQTILFRISQLTCNPIEDLLAAEKAGPTAKRLSADIGIASALGLSC
jgi:hypothetical protein